MEDFNCLISSFDGQCEMMMVFMNLRRVFLELVVCEDVKWDRTGRGMVWEFRLQDQILLRQEILSEA